MEKQWARLAEDGLKHLVLVGDNGLGEHNVGALFDLAGQTRKENLMLAGKTAVVQRVSSVADFAAALTGNGTIDGTVTFFGHGGMEVRPNNIRSSALFVGEQPGFEYNLTQFNVGTLSNSNLGPNATITLNACNVGYGGRQSIANLLARQLQRKVYAYIVDMYFSSDPTPRRWQPGMASPNGVPTYMVPNGNVQPTEVPLR